MRWTARCLVGGTAVAMLAGIAPVATAAPGGTTTRPAATPAGQSMPAGQSTLAGQSTMAAKPRAVTLLTGDRVLVRQIGKGATRITVSPGVGRQGTHFLHRKIGGEDFVFPADARRLIAAGVLDRRLFNVTRLLRDGFGDAATGSLPLIVRYAPGAAGQRARRTAAPAVDEGRPLPAIDAYAVRTDKTDTARFWSQLAARAPGARRAGRVAAPAGIAKVWLDRRIRVRLEQSVPQIGAPAAWRAGYQGAGVKVAVLDTGIDVTHPDLRDAVAASRNFTTAPDVKDLVGHGTHVASTIAGTGAAGGGRYKGVAPQAKLLIGKVCETDFCSDSAILAGMQWAADSGAKVVNLSLGDIDEPELDPLEEAVNTLTARTGTLFVVAAGNDGPTSGTVGTPGSADAALTVGAVTKQDQLAEFSSRGPRLGDGAIKPELTAPGQAIVAARAVGTLDADAVGRHYARLDGTSMATPHVVGAAAILAQQHPDWKAEQLKAALVGSVHPLPGVNAFDGGAGRLDVARAIGQQVAATPATVSFGTAMWPHEDDPDVTRSLTYRNTGAAPATLRLSVAGQGPEGAPVPAGMFTLGAAQVTVPAGGTATVPVTVSTRVPARNGQYTALVTAASPDGRTAVRTPMAVDRESERYNLRLTGIDRRGNAPTTMLLDIFDSAGNSELWFVDESSITLRLPRDTYRVVGMVDTADPQDPDAHEAATLEVKPGVTLDRDVELVFDSRRGKPVDVAVPEPSARLVEGTVGLAISTEDMHVQYSLVDGGPDMAGFTRSFVVPTTSTLDNAVFFVRSFWAKPNQDGFAGSPYLYNLAGYRRGGIPDGFRQRPARSDLATVRTGYGAPAAGRFGLSLPLPAVGETTLGEDPQLIPMPLPYQRTEYFGGEGVQWLPAFAQLPAADADLDRAESFQTGAPRSYQAGRAYREQWNVGVFGPGLTTEPEFPVATRFGNTIETLLPLFSDSEPRHLGEVPDVTGTTTLYRNGVRVGTAQRPDEAAFTVPSGAATYRLVTVAAVPGRVSRVSSRISTAWTFRSSHVPGEQSRPLPLLVARFQPDLDLSSRAPANRVFRFPVTVQSQPGTSRVIKTFTVDVSYDGGATWKKAQVRKGTRNWSVSVTHPASPGGYVALRAFVADTAGNAVQQTVLRAYQLR